MKKLRYEDRTILFIFGTIVVCGLAIAAFCFVTNWNKGVMNSETVSIMPIDYLGPEQPTDMRFNLGLHSSKAVQELEYYDYYEQDKTGAYKPVSEEVKSTRVVKDLKTGQQAYLTRDICRDKTTRNVVLHLPEKTNIVQVDWE